MYGGGRVAERVVKVKLLAQVSDYEKGMLAAAQATRTVGTESEKLAQKKQAFEQVGQGLVVTGAALTAVTALSVKAALDWESAWAGVTKTVDGSDEQMARLEGGLRELAQTLPATHQEIAAVAEAAGQLGVAREDVVDFTKTMIDLSETTNLTADEAATSIAQLMNVMQTAPEDVDNLGAALVALGNDGASTERDIIQMAQRIAGAGRVVGLTEAQVLGFANALASVGIEAEAGGSAISRIMTDIAMSVSQGGEKLDQFAKVAGMSSTDFQKAFKEAPAEAIATFIEGLGRINDTGGDVFKTLSDLGQTDIRVSQALLGMANSGDLLRESLELGSVAWEENTALAVEAAKRYETTESKITVAGNAIRDAAIDFGQVFLPAVGAAADGVAQFAQFMGGLPDPVQGVVGILTASVGALALTGGTALLAVPKIAEFKAAFDTLGWSLKSFALIGGGVVLALTALVTVIGSVASAQAAAQAKAEAYADTLAEGSNKITKATREMALEALQANSKLFGMFDLGGLSAADAAEKLGLSLSTVTDAATGNASALRELLKVQKEIEGSDYTALQEKYGDDYVLAESRINQVVDAVKGENASLEDAIALAEQFNRGAEETGDASEVAAAGFNEIDAAATEANRSLEDTIAALDGVARSALDVAEAKDAALSAINGMRDAAEAEGVSLDGTNDASIRFRDSIRSVEEAHRDSAEAILQNGGTLEEANGAWEAGRQAVIDMLTAKGMDIEQAKAWADQNLGSAQSVKTALAEVKSAVDNVPPAKVIDLRVTGTSEVYNELMRVQDVLRSVTGNRSLHVSTGQGGQGGLAFASGGRVVGPGTGTSDSIPAWLSDGEHVIPADEVQAAGGHEAIERYRAMIGRGSEVEPQYIRGSWVGGQAGAQVSVSAPSLPPIYIQNPFTGEYLLAKTAEVAGRQVASYDASRERTTSRGVRV